MPDDKLTAALDEERAILAAAADAADLKKWRVAAEIYGTLKADALISAVCDALKVADDWTEPDGAYALADDVRKAISRALLGKEGSGDA